MAIQEEPNISSRRLLLVKVIKNTTKDRRHKVLYQGTPKRKLKTHTKIIVGNLTSILKLGFPNANITSIVSSGFSLAKSSKTCFNIFIGFWRTRSWARNPALRIVEFFYASSSYCIFKHLLRVGKCAVVTPSEQFFTVSSTHLNLKNQWAVTGFDPLSVAISQPLCYRFHRLPCRQFQSGIKWDVYLIR